MSADASAIVTEFCKEFDVPAPDAERLAAYFAEDAVYHNIPMQPVNGRAAIAAVLGGMTKTMQSAGWEVKHQVAEGGMVMNERVDRFKIGDKLVAIPVTGVFEVRAGKIAAWRDYFDLATWQNQLK